MNLQSFSWCSCVYLRKGMSFVWSFSASSVRRSSGGLVHGHLEDATLPTRSGLPLLSLMYYRNGILFRIEHAFTCADILPSQYIHFTTQANLGMLGPYYINSGEYLDTVNTCAKLSMMMAAAEVKALPNYAASSEICVHSIILPIVLWYLSIVGHYRCSTRLDIQRLPHHRPLLIWKVIMH